MRREPLPEDETWEDDEEEAGSADANVDVRVDKWLWAARLFKTRNQAAEACDGGHVKLNGATTKPAKSVRPGDRLELTGSGLRRIVVVKLLSARRGPAEVAATLYEDHSPPPPPKQPAAPRWERTEGRPTKRDRRQMDRFRGW